MFQCTIESDGAFYWIAFQYDGYLIEDVAHHGKLGAFQLLAEDLLAGSWIENPVMIVIVSFVQVVIAQNRDSHV